MLLILQAAPIESFGNVTCEVMPENPLASVGRPIPRFCVPKYRQMADLFRKNHIGLNYAH